ncbi:MAG: beta-galactosidase trimerization domain-containing protein, partial [Bryobacter sp.]|nr:beta-galactosidase trimerization domain-containing protein [Bryobacter sp.]
PVVEQLYTWHWKNERYLRNTENLARVGLVYSQQSAMFYAGDKARERIEDPQLGWYQALIEARIPFEMVHDRKLQPEALRAFRVLILPNIAALSAQQCQQLESFVAAGGSLIATGETSLYDEWGERRADFGLARLFGCSFGGRIDDRLQNSYLTLEHATRHPLLAGLADTPRIINGVRWIVTNPHAGGAPPPLTLIPSYPDLPMESVYTLTPHTDQPAVYCSQVSAGRVVYFPMDIDRTFWEVLSADHALLLRNAVNWASPSAAPVRMEGKGLLDIAVWRQRDSLTLHVVNLSNPMAMKGPFRETYPVGPLHIEWELPHGVRPRAAKLLVAAKPLAWQRKGESIIFNIQSVDLHEVLAIDIEGQP